MNTIHSPELAPTFLSKLAARPHEMITALGLTATIALSATPAQANVGTVDKESTDIHHSVANIAMSASTKQRVHYKAKPKQPEWVPSVIGKRKLGVAISNRFASSPDYLETVKNNFDMVVAENEGKSHLVIPNQNLVDAPLFGPMDAILGTATSNKLSARYHTLVFGEQEPAWIKKIGYQCRDNFLNGKKAGSIALDGYLNRYIDAFGRKYKGSFEEIDVVNEPVENDGSIEKNAWFSCLGKEYIDKAFVAAHKADRQARLFINENGVELPGPKQDALVEIIKTLKERNIPINGIGLQTHVDLKFIDSIAEFEKSLQRFADLGLVINLTELDIALSENPTAADFQKQTKTYEAIIRACIKQRACGNVIVWGVSDDKSWLSKNSPTLFGMDGINYAPKPAYKIIRKLLR